MRTFATRLLGLVFLSSLGACCIEPVGAVSGGRYQTAACDDDAVGPACVHPSGVVVVGSGWRTPAPGSDYRAHGYARPTPPGHGSGHPVSHGGGHGGSGHGGSAGSHSGGSHGGRP